MPPPEGSENDDAQLVDAAQSGDVRALERLLERHEAKVLRVVRFLGVPARDREDVTQEIFIRVFRHLGSFDRSRPFAGWLYRVAVNAAQDYRAKASRHEAGATPWTEEIGETRAGGADPEAAVGEQALRRRLEAALERLSARERAVFVLKELEELSTVEVARALGVTSITVRRHLSLAKARLRAILREEKNPPDR